MTNDDYEEFVDGLALIGITPQPVSPETLLRALLDQNGHYVSDKIVELMEVVGCSPRTGWAVVIPQVEAGQRCILPPGFSYRESGERYGAFFYEESHGKNHGPWVIDPRKDRDAFYAAAKDPLLVDVCRIACARWGEPSESTNSRGQRLTYFPWGLAHPTESVPDAGVQHARWFVEGEPAAAVAVAAGRLGHDALAIVGARWMFNNGRKPDSSHDG